MAKLDLKKELKHLYKASAKKPSIVQVPEMSYLVIDGKGDPNEAQSFQDAMEALYGIAYTLKFSIKFSDPEKDFVVMPLEGLWWVDDMESFLSSKKEDWFWTVMIMLPDYITSEQVEASRETVREKKNPSALDKVRFVLFSEGEAVQILHIGPYDAEKPTIEMLHQFIEESGYERRGKHHEIYLGDPRRTSPEKLKTIIRQPVAPV